MVQAARAAADRVFEILDEPAEVDFRESEPFNPTGRIEYRDVSFSYVDGQPVLRRCNVRSRTRTNDCAGGCDRSRKIDVGQPLVAFL